MRPSQFAISSVINGPPEVSFDLSRSIDLHQDSMSRSKERAVAGVTSGLISLGEEVTWEARHFGIRWHMTSRIVAFDRPRSFTDEMVRGRFTRYRHEHRFTPVPEGTLMEDDVTFAAVAGPLSLLVDPLVAWYLKRLFRIRNRAIRAKAEAHS